MVQNHWPAYKSQVAFEDLYWMQASANNKLNKGLLFRCTHGPPSTASSRWPTSRQASRRVVGADGGGVDVTTDCLTDTILSINIRLLSAMQVSYGKLTVNDGKEMGEDGCLAPEARRHTIGRCHVALHGWKLHISAAGKNSLLYEPRISRSPNF